MFFDLVRNTTCSNKLSWVLFRNNCRKKRWQNIDFFMTLKGCMSIHQEQIHLTTTFKYSKSCLFQDKVLEEESKSGPDCPLRFKWIVFKPISRVFFFFLRTPYLSILEKQHDWSNITSGICKRKYWKIVGHQ